MNDMPPTPALDKQRRAREEGHSQEIGAFLEWLASQGIQRMRWVDYDIDSVGYPDRDGDWVPDGRSIERLLADYFEVDLDAIDAERRAILEVLRAARL